MIMNDMNDKITDKVVKAIVERNLIKKTNKEIKRRFLKAERNAATAASRLYVNKVMSPSIPTDPQTIFFTNFSGEFECNPGYICKELLKRNNNYKLIFAVWPKGKKQTKFPEQFPEGVTTVARYSYDYYKALSSAKIIIDNGTSFISAGYKKKDDQILISTWHGSLGIKRFCKDDTDENKKYNKKAQAGADVVDYMISNSAFENFYFRDTYWPKTPIMMLGHARNDILFKDPSSDEIQDIKKRVCDLYDIPEGASLCLYAPTFRDNDKNDGGKDTYTLDYEKLHAALTEKYGGEWVILLKLHFRTKRLVKFKQLPEYIRNVSDYPDIQELLAVIDVGITDYSSWICEYIHTKKPGFLFATDLENYNLERGFYDPIDGMPFPLTTNSDELADNILKFDQKKYETACDEFIAKKGCIDDGKAASRICDQIDNLIQGCSVSCKVYTGTEAELEEYKVFE